MRLLRTKILGMGVLREVDLDLASIDAKIVAIQGPNGAGKSTLLDLAIPGALYRDTPTRGTLAELATERDSFVESTFELGGSNVTVRQSVDARSGKGEAVIVRGAEVLNPTGKVTDGDRILGAMLPARSMLLASMYAEQGGSTVLDMTSGERIAVVLRAVGSEGLEDLSKKVSELARAAANDAAGLSYALDNIAPPSPRLDERIVERRAELEHVERQLDAAAQAKESALAWEKRTALEREIESLRAKTSRAEAVALAVAETEEISAELIALVPAESTAATEAASEASEHAARRHQEWELALAKCERDLKSTRAKILHGSAVCSEAKSKRASVVAEIEQTSLSISLLDRQSLALADRRIGALSSTLRAIVEGAADPAALALRALESDAAELESEANNRLRAADLRRHMSILTSAGNELFLIADRLGVELAAEERIAQLEAERSDLKGRVADLLAAREAASAAHALAVKERREAKDKANALRARARELTPLVELRGAMTEYAAALAVRESDLAALPSVDRPDPDARSPESLQIDATTIRSTLARLAKEREIDAENAARREATAAQLETARQRASDLQYLAESLGKDGLQSFEVDQAAPFLTDSSNTLLRSCLGDRWSIQVDTKRTSADGKRQLDDCTIMVSDGESAPRPASSLSGGEKVLVGEAVSLALTALACERGGIERPTLVRDESGAALDEEKSIAYVAMLRRAADMIGADKVLVVSHSERVRAECDARITVDSGTVSA